MLLKRDGLIETEPNMGAKVREWNPERHIGRLDVRIALESEIGMLAAERATSAELRELVIKARELDTLEIASEEDRKQASAMDGEVHRSIARASHSPELLEFWEISVVQPLKDFPASYWREHVALCQPWSHTLLVQGIVSRDPVQAREAVRRHIAYSRSIDVRVMGLEWKYPQYVADGVPVEVDEESFRSLLEDQA
jgi:DNA-binding GntR family transcriptional regulator